MLKTVCIGSSSPRRNTSTSNVSIYCIPLLFAGMSILEASFAAQFIVKSKGGTVIETFLQENMRAHIKSRQLLRNHYFYNVLNIYSFSILHSKLFKHQWKDRN